MFIFLQKISFSQQTLIDIYQLLAIRSSLKEGNAKNYLLKNIFSAYADISRSLDSKILYNRGPLHHISSYLTSS